MQRAPRRANAALHSPDSSTFLTATLKVCRQIKNPTLINQLKEQSNVTIAILFWLILMFCYVL